jgi:hypothetical protein
MDRLGSIECEHGVLRGKNRRRADSLDCFADHNTRQLVPRRAGTEGAYARRGRPEPYKGTRARALFNMT